MTDNLNDSLGANIKLLIEARKAFYGTGRSIMTDQEYDSLEAMVKRQYPDHPLFETVGHPVSSAWEKAEHNIFMGSLDKVHTEEEFMKWVHKFDDLMVLFSLQFKLDGASLSLDYEKGEFVQGTTRGNGEVGEDISPNVALMKGFKGNIGSDYTGSVRAEILLGKKDFEKINQILSEEDAYSNPRNAAAGICRRLDGKFSKYLQIVTYDITEDIDEPDKLQTLKNFGFYTPVQVIGDYNKMIDAYNKIKVKRKDLPYDIDGVVVKAVSFALQESMGVSRKRPKAQKAWKFEPPGAATIFHKEIWDVGRTGVVTPLAHLEPVEIEGSIVKKATLHNVAEIKRLGIGRGDTVMLVKRGDIIPKIESVLKHEGHPIRIPTRCPSCDNLLDNDGTTLRCAYDGCPRKIFYRIMNWIKVVEIDTFGQSLAEVLFEIGKLCSIADIYRLTFKDISSIERWGEKSAGTIMTNIEKTKRMSAEKFLCALGIPSISESTSAELLQAFETLDNLMDKSVDDIKKLKGFSDISATKVVEGLKKNKQEIEFLLTMISLGSEKSSGILGGMSFCFTGAMEHPRSYYQKIVTQLGGENKKSVVKELTYLVCDEDKRSSKSVKAEKYGVKVISSNEFLGLAGNPVPEVKEEPKPVKLVEDCGSLFDEE